MFVRIKKIKGRPYAYLVENEWTPWGSRQRVAKYLGKTHMLERLSDGLVELPKGLNDSILAAAAQELKNHGFQEEYSTHVKGEVVVNLKERTVKEKSRNVVLSMNEGFLCEHTLKQLLAFEPEERPDKSAQKLASHVLEAGLKLSDEQFVHLFEQVKEDKNE